MGMFTGGTSVGSLVMQRAAKSLTPVTLELGGKNPAFFDKMNDGLLGAAIREVVTTKQNFSGEFCQCHDVLLVLDSMYDKVVAAMKKSIEDLGDRRMVRLIHQKHYQRVKQFLDSHNGSNVPDGVACDAAGLCMPITMVLEPRSDDLIM